MTLSEYNEVRRALKMACLIAFAAFVAIVCFAFSKRLGLLLGATALCLGFAGLMAFYLKKLEGFRCPRCGEDPVAIVGDDGVWTDTFATQCVRCKASLGEY